MCPVAAGIEAADRGIDLAFGAVQAADAAEQIGKTLEVADFSSWPRFITGGKRIISVPGSRLRVIKAVSRSIMSS